MHRLALTGLLPVLFAASGAAQTSPVVTEAEFLSVLDDSHPAVAEKAEAVAVARAQVVAVATLENPELGVVREDPRGPVGQTDWTISWQLPQSGRGLEIRAREKAVAAAEARLSRDLLLLRLAMREVYAEWAVAAARRDRLAAQATRVEALAAREARRAELGETAGLDAHRLTLAAAGLRARGALVAAVAQKARASARGWYPELPRHARPLLPSLPPATPLAGDHPLLRAARAELGAAKLGREAAGRFVRSPELTVGWQRQEVGPDSREGPILGLAWSLPMFARNRAEQAVGEARVTAARARVERVRRELDSARASAVVTYRRLVLAGADIAAAIAGNEKMVRGAEAVFGHGEGSVTNLLETLRSAAESEMAMLDLHQAALAAHREVERLAASGGPPAPLSTSPPQERTP